MQGTSPLLSSSSEPSILPDASAAFSPLSPPTAANIAAPKPTTPASAAVKGYGSLAGDRHTPSPTPSEVERVMNESGATGYVKMLPIDKSLIDANDPAQPLLSPPNAITPPATRSAASSTSSLGSSGLTPTAGSLLNAASRDSALSMQQSHRKLSGAGIGTDSTRPPPPTLTNQSDAASARLGFSTPPTVSPSVGISGVSSTASTPASVTDGQKSKATTPTGQQQEGRKSNNTTTSFPSYAQGEGKNHGDTTTPLLPRVNEQTTVRQEGKSASDDTTPLLPKFHEAKMQAEITALLKWVFEQDTTTSPRTAATTSDGLSPVTPDSGASGVSMQPPSTAPMGYRKLDDETLKAELPTAVTQMDFKKLDAVIKDIPQDDLLALLTAKTTGEVTELINKIGSDKILALIGVVDPRKAAELKKEEKLPDEDSRRKMIAYNVISLIPTVLSGILYYNTTIHDDTLVRLSTAGSNLLQNQYFMYTTAKKLHDAGLSKLLIFRAVSGLLATVPYIIANHVTSNPVDGVSVPVQDVGDAVGFFPLNVFVLDDYVAGLKKNWQQLKEQCCKDRGFEEQCRDTVKVARERFAKTINKYFDGLTSDDALDPLDIKREYDLPEQIRALLSNSAVKLEEPQEDHRGFQWLVKIFGVIGGVFLCWSSLGYGGVAGAALLEQLISCGCSSGAGLTCCTQCTGHILSSPLYYLSYGGGSTVGEAIPQLPWLLAQMHENPHFRWYVASRLLTMIPALIIAGESYGTSKGLMSYIPKDFFSIDGFSLGEFLSSSDFSLGVAQWCTDFFNGYYTTLPLASGVDVVIEKSSSPTWVARMDKYKQLKARSKQIEGSPDGAFIEVCQRLYEADRRSGNLNNGLMKKILGEQLSTELMQAMIGLRIIENRKQLEEQAQNNAALKQSARAKLGVSAAAAAAIGFNGSGAGGATVGGADNKAATSSPPKINFLAGVGGRKHSYQSQTITRGNGQPTASVAASQSAGNVVTITTPPVVSSNAASASHVATPNRQ